MELNLQFFGGRGGASGVTSSSKKTTTTKNIKSDTQLASEATKLLESKNFIEGLKSMPIGSEVDIKLRGSSRPFVSNSLLHVEKRDENTYSVSTGTSKSYQSGLTAQEVVDEIRLSDTVTSARVKTFEELWGKY